MKVGYYTLDLYCSNEECTKPMPHEFTGQTEARCIREAREKGWLISKGKELCPACSGKTPKPKRTRWIPISANFSVREGYIDD